MARICNYVPVTGTPANDSGVMPRLPRGKAAMPTPSQWSYLRRGLTQPGGKLPLFDDYGQRYPLRTIQSCIDQGWAEPWFANPIKPDWTVCRLTKRGAALIQRPDAKPLAAKPRSA